jgi:hypothetical protein
MRLHSLSRPGTASNVMNPVPSVSYLRRRRRRRVST